MSIEIHIVDNPADREEIFAFRYSIYVRELNRQKAYVDHSHRRIEEPLDRTGVIFGAYDGNSLVGTVRYNWTDGDVGYYRDLYQMEIVGPYLNHGSTMTTRLMVSRDHRHGTVGMRLAIAAFESAYKAGSRFDFIDCYDDLKSFFEKMGYRQINKNHTHPDYGAAVPMLLVTADRRHLESVKSPFLQVVQRYPEETQSVDYFYQSVLPVGTESKLVRPNLSRGEFHLSSDDLVA